MRQKSAQPICDNKNILGRELNDDEIYINTSKAAAFAGFEKRSFDMLRIRGGGAPYIKRNTKVLYKLSSLKKWLNENGERTSTASHAEKDTRIESNQLKNGGVPIDSS